MGGAAQHGSLFVSSLNIKIEAKFEGLNMQSIFVDLVVSFSELKKHPSEVMAGSGGKAIADLDDLLNSTI